LKKSLDERWVQVLLVQVIDCFEAYQGLKKYSGPQLVWLFPPWALDRVKGLLEPLDLQSKNCLKAR